MKCQEANESLVAYVDGEVSPSERALIQAHLARCDACQEELAVLSALQRRLSRSLQVRAAQASPSPQAWSRLQARWAGEARPSPWGLPAWLQPLAPGVGRIIETYQGSMTMKRGFALAALVALVIGLGTVAFVPSVRAQVGEILEVWFRFETPGGHGEVAISGTAGFVPLHPTYLPAAFQTLGFVIGSVSGESDSIELIYRSEQQFLTLTQTEVSGDKALPAVREVTVNGQPAILVTDLEGTFEVGHPIQEGARVEAFGTPPAESVPYHGTIAYTDGKRFTWYAGDIKIEMLSNLSEEEMLRIAESMAPAEAGEGEPPFQLRLTLPSGDEGGIIMREGPIEFSP